jgi:hypothetical protein
LPSSKAKTPNNDWIIVAFIIYSSDSKIHFIRFV